MVDRVVFLIMGANWGVVIIKNCIPWFKLNKICEEIIRFYLNATWLTGLKYHLWSFEIEKSTVAILCLDISPQASWTLLLSSLGYGLPDDIVIEKRGKGDTFVDCTGADIKISSIKFIQHDAVEGILSKYLNISCIILFQEGKLYFPWKMQFNKLTFEYMEDWLFMYT